MLRAGKHTRRVKSNELSDVAPGNFKVHDETVGIGETLVGEGVDINWKEGQVQEKLSLSHMTYVHRTLSC